MTWNTCWLEVIIVVKSNQFVAIADRSFSFEHKECMLAHWKLIFRKKIFRSGGFIAKVLTCIESAYIAEAYSGLGVLLAVKEVLDSLEEKCRIDFCIRTDC